jgi:lipoate-protein ligase B
MVDHLDRLTGDSRGVRKFVDAALAVALHVGQIYDPGASVREGAEMGVWKSDGSKFAALGVHIEQRVVMHGIAINGYRAEPSFVGIRPCGLESPVGYLFDESTHFETLGEQILKAITLDFPRVKVARSSRSACFEQTPENLDRAKDLPAREAD